MTSRYDFTEEEIDADDDPLLAEDDDDGDPWAEFSDAFYGDRLARLEHLYRLLQNHPHADTVKQMIRRDELITPDTYLLVLVGAAGQRIKLPRDLLMEIAAGAGILEDA